MLRFSFFTIYKQLLELIEGLCQIKKIIRLKTYVSLVWKEN